MVVVMMMIMVLLPMMVMVMADPYRQVYESRPAVPVWHIPGAAARWCCSSPEHAGGSNQNPQHAATAS